MTRTFQACFKDCCFLAQTTPIDVAMSLPPAYSPDSVHASFLESEPLEPPTYTPRPVLSHLTQTANQPRKEFTANLSKKGIPWAVLTMLGNPGLSPSIPTILEGSDIVGSVKLNLDKEDGIHSVVVLVSCEYNLSVLKLITSRLKAGS